MQEIAKQKERKVSCPACGNTIFSRTMTEAVEMIVTKDLITDVLVQEPSVAVNESYACSKCGRVLIDKEVGKYVR